VDLSELCRPYSSGHSRGGGDTGKGFVVVFTGDPYGGTIREAGCLGEDHGVVCFGSHSVDPPPDESGRGRTVLELDRIEVGGGVSDVILLHLIGDRFQDLQEFGTVGSAVQQGSSKVSGHRLKWGIECAGSL